MKDNNDLVFPVVALPDAGLLQPWAKQSERPRGY